MRAASPDCWRTAPCRGRARAAAGRSRTHWIDFLGTPAAFSDGAFRLAALLRRPVVFMAGLYLGGGRYQLRFAPLADFSEARATAAPQRDAAVEQAVLRYAGLLEQQCRETPRNWFNFFDFWAGSPARRTLACERRDLPERSPRPARAAAGARPHGRPVRAAGFDLQALMQQLAQVRSGQANFVEDRRVQQLDQTLRSSGRLSFTAPDTFVRETLRPAARALAVVGNQLTMSRGNRSRTALLDSVPEAAVIVEAIRGTLTGNRDDAGALLRHHGARQRRAVALDLVPRDPRLREQVSHLRLTGRQGQVREVRMTLADGDTSVMRIEPVRRRPPARP